MAGQWPIIFSERVVESVCQSNRTPPRSLLNTLCLKMNMPKKVMIICRSFSVTFSEIFTSKHVYWKLRSQNQVCNLWFSHSVFSIKHRRGLRRGLNTPAQSDVHENTLLHYYLCANPHHWWPDAPCWDAPRYFTLLLYFQRGQQSRPHPLLRTSILYISGLEWKQNSRLMRRCDWHAALDGGHRYLLAFWH